MTSCFSNSTPTFQPALRIVSAITNANPAVVTTTLAHDYITGEIVRLKIPLGFGMLEANNLEAEIVVTATDKFELKIDSTKFDSFAAPSPLPSAYTCPQVIPIGEISSLLTAATTNVLREARG